MANTYDEIIELPLSFTRKKLNYKQVYNDGKWYIYRIADTPEYFEVFKRTLTRYRFYDKEAKKWITRHEKTGMVRYPTDEDFGVFAWCCRSLERCHELMKVNKLN